MNRAENLAQDEADAQAAVKAYLRLFKARVAEDSELLTALLPERFGDAPNISDYQRFVIDRLAAENAALKAERDRLRREIAYFVRALERSMRTWLQLPKR